MAKTIEEWLDTDVAELEKLSLVELGNTFFFRDICKMGMPRFRVIIISV